MIFETGENKVVDGLTGWGNVYGNSLIKLTNLMYSYSAVKFHFWRIARKISN